MDDGTMFWGLLVAAGVAGWGVTLLIQRHLWLVLGLAGGAIAVAWWYVSGADPQREYDQLGRLVMAGIPLTGWLLGLGATSVWIFARRAGEKSKQRSGAAPT
jgi:hypothetical protein